MRPLHHLMLWLLASWRSACAASPSWRAGCDGPTWPVNRKNWPTSISARNHDLIDLLSRLTLYGASSLSSFAECRREWVVPSKADSARALLLDCKLGSHINWATDIPLRVSLPE